MKSFVIRPNYKIAIDCGSQYVYIDLAKHMNGLNLRLPIEQIFFTHFKTCEIFSYTTETQFPVVFAFETLSAMNKNFNFDSRFSDFDVSANEKFFNPFHEYVHGLFSVFGTIYLCDKESKLTHQRLKSL